jgi:hypothetical protein
MQIWRQRQQTAVQQAKAFSDGLAHAYTPGDWDQTLPLNYPSPQPLHVPEALPDVPDLPVPHLWSAEREHIPIVPPPQVDHEAERDRLEEQAQLLRELAKERDEFGEQFFDENDESPELREAFAALGQCSYQTGRCRQLLTFKSYLQVSMMHQMTRSMKRSTKTGMGDHLMHHGLIKLYVLSVFCMDVRSLIAFTVVFTPYYE